APGGKVPFLPDPPVPAQFSPVTTVTFVLPAQQSLPGTAPPPLYASVVWAFARGADCITVEAGASSQSQPPWKATDPSKKVSLPLGTAQSVLRSDGPELRVDLGGSRWVRVRGTVSPAVLEAYARTIPKAA